MTFKLKFPLRFIVLFNIVLLYCFPTYAQSEFSLSDVIKIALQNNLQLKQVQITEKSSILELSKSKWALLPNLASNNYGTLYFTKSLDPTTNIYSNSSSISSTFNLTSSVILFQGFQKVNQIKENKFLLEKNKSAFLKAQNDLIIQVITTFLAALNYRDQLLASQQQRELAIQQVENEQKSYRIGKRNAADVSRAEYQVSKADVDIETSKNQYNGALVDLGQLMNFKPGREISIISPNDTDSFQINRQSTLLYNHALQILPEIKQAEFNRLSADKELQIAKGAHYPTLTLSNAIATSYSYQFHFEPSIFSTEYTQPAFFNQLRKNIYEYVGLNLSIPIFNGYLTKFQVKQARLNLESAIIDEESTRNNLYKIVNQAVLDFNAAQKIYAFTKQAYESAKQTFKVVQKRYENHLSNSLDLNQALGDLNQAEFAVIHAKYDLIFKKKTIEFYDGAPFQY